MRGRAVAPPFVIGEGRVTRSCRCHQGLTKQPPNGLEPLTCGLQNRCSGDVTPEANSTCEPADSCTPSGTPSNLENRPDLASLKNQLAALSEADRRALLDAMQSPGES